MNDLNIFSIPDELRVQKFVDFGEDALAAEDLDELLHTAAKNVAEGLGEVHSKILTPMKDGRLLLRAGVGWDPELIGKASVSGDIDSPAGYALKTGRPVRSNDLSREDRFERPRLLADYNIKSAINVLIAGEDEPFGVLEVDSTEVRDFTEAHTAFLQTYAQLLSAAVIRVRQTEALEAKSQENELLLQELHHRIGNDLQLVLSLINFRSRQLQSEESKRVLSWVATRIRSLAHVHEQLRKNRSSTRIDLGAYLRELCKDLGNVHNLPNREVRLDLATERWMTGSKDAVSIGLIVNEFITNSIEHAFAEKGGTISVTLSREADNGILTIEDDGDGFTMPKKSDRSGLGLMHQLAETVGTNVESRTEGGVQLRITLNPEIE